MSVAALPPRVQKLHARVRSIIDEHVIPLEAELYEHHTNPDVKWTIHPKVEELKVRHISLFSFWGISYFFNLFTVEYQLAMD